MGHIIVIIHIFGWYYMNHLRQNTGSIQMEGGYPLNGSVSIQGSKNATLPVMAASLLIPQKSIIKGCPDITDVMYMSKLIECAGADIKADKCFEGLDICIDAENVKEYRLPAKYVSTMRSSVVLMGALLGRMGEVCVDYPGGCVIGSRPIDLHLYGLERLGAQIWIDKNHIHAYADELIGAEIKFPFQSVGATQNAILAAVTARGKTIIKNAAREPEVTALCEFLKLAGADIKLSDDFMFRGEIIIHGVELSRLKGVEYDVIPDRIVAGTYLFAALAAGGNITLEKCPIEHMDSVFGIIKQMGANLSVDKSKEIVSLEVCNKAVLRNLAFIETDVYPAFPTDLQSPLMAAACVLNGELKLKEKIFSSRFKIIEELQRMGADIDTIGTDTALIKGNNTLTGRNVIARELRGGAALVIAGLAAEGITTVSDAGYISRGYQNIAQDLQKLGARIKYAY